MGLNHEELCALADRLQRERDAARESLKRAQARSRRQRAALKITVEACQSNLAYAMRKDEHALVRALEAAQAALKK